MKQKIKIDYRTKNKFLITTSKIFQQFLFSEKFSTEEIKKQIDKMNLIHSKKLTYSVRKKIKGTIEDL